MSGVIPLLPLYPFMTWTGTASFLIRFSLSVSFHQYSILIYIFILLSLEGRAGDPANLRSKDLPNIRESECTIN